MEFYDSYVFIDGIQSKEGLPTDTKITTLSSNLAEVYYVLLRIFNKKTADHFFNKIKEIAQDIPQEIIPEAMQFRYEHRKKKFSHADALGYTYARKHNITFVTGDKAFKGLEGVRVIR
ncbi:type II toxin-antitoxin system VapC family toxin [Candidatus Woesearchaeota archaeon]|nr:type II toxin-antitoxin system VapC family toxin [Candidatus Woesearchaeota archaeon]